MILRPPGAGRAGRAPAIARRLLARGWGRWARRAGLTVMLGAQAALGQTIVDATYADPTDRYPHGVLGDDLEWASLILTLSDRSQRRHTLPQERVFEDVAPRVQDLDGDGAAEVIVVESHQSLGAALAIYGPQGQITATPAIGTRFRWLAPTGQGAADLDGDGRVELAYIDRPHLAKTLRIWRYANGALTPVAQMAGLTNHRIGERDIAGGIRSCAGAPEIIVATANWRRLVAVRLQDDRLRAEEIGAHTGRDSFAKAMACD